ncbi:hypothetical protein GH714_044078 [Hevea brasiliensis]|uniref:Uncharacterized protein n=1 Tax=Hevea brasiliensis TaxID=3981 RepID=A0A6A6K113_HEVBR|nr:hypothetical protein GH714_044078 [Hevea brasiliensis]
MDEIINSPEEAYQDRFGKARLTWAGVEAITRQSLTNFGYVTVDSFEDGATLTSPNQVLRYESNGAWLSVGDAALRTQLSSSTGADIIGYGSSTVADTLDEQQAEINSFRNDSDLIVDDFMVAGETTIDNAFQLALTQAKTTGRPIRFLAKNYTFAQPSEWLMAQRGIKIYGAGSGRSVINFPNAQPGVTQLISILLLTADNTRGFSNGNVWNCVDVENAPQGEGSNIVIEIINGNYSQPTDSYANIVDPNNGSGVRITGVRNNVTQPNMPGSGSAFRNVTGQTISVYIWGGNVSSVSVNGFGIGLTSGMFIVKPWDTIAIKLFFCAAMEMRESYWSGVKTLWPAKSSKVVVPFCWGGFKIDRKELSAAKNAAEFGFWNNANYHLTAAYKAAVRARLLMLLSVPMHIAALKLLAGLTKKLQRKSGAQSDVTSIHFRTGWCQEIKERIKQGQMSYASGVAVTREHGEKAVEVVEEAHKEAKAAGKDKITAKQLNKKPKKETDVPRIMQLLKGATQAAFGKNDYLCLQPGVIDELMELINGR